MIASTLIRYHTLGIRNQISACFTLTFAWRVRVRGLNVMRANSSHRSEVHGLVAEPKPITPPPEAKIAMRTRPSRRLESRISFRRRKFGICDLISHGLGRTVRKEATMLTMPGQISVMFFKQRTTFSRLILHFLGLFCSQTTFSRFSIPNSGIDLV